MANIWFVVHHQDLWEIDNCRIGFHRKYQWDLLKIGDIVIYGRAGEKQIKGVFKIVTKEIEKWNSFPKFAADGIYKDLEYQCKLKLLSDDIICGYPKDGDNFSFLSEYKASFNGNRKQVFRAKREDLKLILVNPQSFTN